MVRRLLAACLDGESGRGVAHTVSFSAGISAGPGPARDRETLYRQADAALFWSKRHGRTCVTIYDPRAPRRRRPPSDRRPSCRRSSRRSPRPARSARSSSRSTT